MAVPAQSAAEWLGAFDNAKLTPRYFVTMALLVFQEMFEFYDFFIVGYIVAVLAPRWHLTYGQSALMLLSAGVGAVVGALVFGKWADRFGRRTLIIAGGVVFAFGCAFCALLPDGAWIAFCALRFVVGFGMAGAVTSQNPLIVEITPTRYRTFLSSLMIAPVAFGTLFAAVLAAHLMPIIGWRGLAATGAFPILVSLGVWLCAPESVRWLLTRSRVDEARREAARQLGVAVEAVRLPLAPAPDVQETPLSDLWQDRGRFFWVAVTWMGAATTTYGVQLWGPTVVSQLLHVPAAEAARYFIVLAICSFAGRIMFSLLPLKIGRRHTGELMGYGSALILLLAGLLHRQFVGGWSVFALLIVFGAIVYSGGFANLTPYTVEAHPVRLGARALGFGQAMNGVGKILGPLCLAFIAGASDMVKPQATAEAVLPAFVFLALCSLACGIAFTLFRVETHGRPLSLFRRPHGGRDTEEGVQPATVRH